MSPSQQLRHDSVIFPPHLHKVWVQSTSRILFFRPNTHIHACTHMALSMSHPRSTFSSGLQTFCFSKLWHPDSEHHFLERNFILFPEKSKNKQRKLYKMVDTDWLIHEVEVEQEVSPRPLRNLLTPRCSLPGSESRYSCALTSNRPEKI